MMCPRDNENPGCPVGETECPRLDELQDAKTEATALSQLVHTDTLTGLFNYRHFLMGVEQEMERTRRTGQPLSLVMVDLDHFKRVNDSWGHEVGNLVLRHVADLMVGELRKIDIPCRYGGEEFALVLPGTELPRAVGVANRLRELIERTPLAVAGQQLAVTASMGADVFTKNDDITCGELVDRADSFLYQAKEQGRNRVCHRDFKLLKPKGQVGREEKEELFRQ